MQIFISTDDLGNVTRIQVAQKGTAGTGVTYEHSVPGAKPGEMVVAPFPLGVTAVTTWAAGLLTAAKEEHVRRTLCDFAGVSAGKLTDVITAINAEKIKAINAEKIKAPKP